MPIARHDFPAIVIAMKNANVLPFLAAAAMAAQTVGFAASPDWPRYLGDSMDSVWQPTAELINDLPKQGLEPTWRQPVGLGYSGPSVANGKVYVMDYVKTGGEITNRPSWKDELTGRERVLCLDQATGKVLWTHEYDRPYMLSYPAGPRCTPTVADGKVYALGAEGDLRCLDAGTGELVWRKSFSDDYGVPTPIWGHSAHPLVHGDSVFCIVGAKDGLAMAFDKQTGKQKWKALSAAEPGYCPPTIIRAGGTEQLLIWHPEGVNSLDPSSGEVHWSLPVKPSFGMSIVPPRRNGSLLFVTGMGHNSGMIRLDDSAPKAELLWRGKHKASLYCSNPSPVFTKEAIYGVDIETSELMAIAPDDGRILWRERSPVVGDSDKKRIRHGTAFLVRQADTDLYWLFNELGEIINAQLTPAGYREIFRSKVIEPTNNTFGRPVVWSHPAFAGTSIYVRNDKEIIRIDVAAK
jgi:outer membrane protein assembly factor BamB